MSQYQSPYNPPSFPQAYGYTPPNQSNAARGAGTLMMVLGGLILLLGIMNLFTSLAVSADEIVQRQKTMMPAPPGGEFQFSADATKTIAIICGFLTVITGALFIILGIGVRRGGKGSMIGGIVLTSVLLLLVGLMALTFAIGGIVAPAFFALSCLTGLAFALLVWQLIWLVAAVRQSGAGLSAAQQYQMQYWQYQQNMQAYSGYGYAQPAPAAPPPTVTPPSAAPPGADNAPNQST